MKISGVDFATYGAFVHNFVTGLALVVISFVIILKAVIPFAKKHAKQKHTAKRVGETKGQWLLGDVIKYNMGTLEGIQNCVERCKEFPAICSQWFGPFYLQIQVYHPDVVISENRGCFGKKCKKVPNSTINQDISPLLPADFLILEEGMVEVPGTTFLPKSYFYKFLVPVLKEGLITSSGEVWKRHRRLLTPIFHFELLRSHVEVFHKNCDLFLKNCEISAKWNRSMDMGQTLCDMSFANMMECVMSQTAADSQGKNSPIIQTLKDASFFILQRTAHPHLWNDFVYKLTKQGRDFSKCCERIHAECRKILKERRSLLKSLATQEGESATFKDSATGKVFSFRKRKGKFVDFLDILVQTKDNDGVGLSDDEIISEVCTFFSAGQETVANGLSMTLYNLANNPEYQKKCRNEIEEVIGEKEEISLDDMGRLVYLTQCIKESLRLTPIVPYISRKIHEDVTFTHRFNGYKEIKVPAGNEAQINIYVLHHNPHVWENPEVFDPERFNAENSAKRSSFAFIPFAAGPRNCIGQHFAMHQMRVVISQALRKYEFYRDADTPKPDIVPAITLQSRNGIQLKARKICYNEQ